jgi:hypothetical protein
MSPRPWFGLFKGTQTCNSRQDREPSDGFHKAEFRHGANADKKIMQQDNNGREKTYEESVEEKRRSDKRRNNSEATTYDETSMRQEKIKVDEPVCVEVWQWICVSCANVDEDEHLKGWGGGGRGERHQ